MIGIMLLTYERTDYAMQTLLGLQDHLRSEEPIHLHIADDGSSDAHREQVHQMVYALQNPHLTIQQVTMSNSRRRGYGGNYNMGTQFLHPDCDIILPLEDDWQLVRTLNLDPLARVLREDPFIDCIRLGYVGWTQTLRGKFHGSLGQTFLLLDPDSPERHVLAGHPRLETRDFERRVGPWPEGLRAGETEFEVCGRTESRRGVVWPADLVHPRGDLFAHIGSVPSDEPIYEEATDG